LLAIGCQFHDGAAIHGTGTSDAPRVVADGPRDAIDDASLLGPPTVTNVGHAHTADASTLTYSFTMPGGSGTLLLVTAQTGENDCPDPGPTVAGITYGGAALTRVAFVLGVPNCATDTRTEVWALTSPPAGTATVKVTLSDPEQTLHSIAIALRGASTTTPIGANAVGAGSGATANIAVDSALEDLVITVAGQGHGITDAGSGSADVLVIDNVTVDTSLDNSAASSLAGAPVTTALWNFDASDNWQLIALSLQP
jgi:hypothetical protein